MQRAFIPPCVRPAYSAFVPFPHLTILARSTRLILAANTHVAPASAHARNFAKSTDKTPAKGKAKEFKSILDFEDDEEFLPKPRASSGSGSSGKRGSRSYDAFAPSVTVTQMRSSGPDLSPPDPSQPPPPEATPTHNGALCALCIAFLGCALIACVGVCGVAAQ